MGYNLRANEVVPLKKKLREELKGCAAEPGRSFK